MGTMKDVARLAGVSTATVSRALKQPDLVTIETRERVMAAVARVGYLPNAAARSLRRRETRMVILVVRDIANPFYLDIYRGIEQCAHELGYNVVMGNTRDDPLRERQYVDMVRAHHADGLLLMTGQLPEGMAATELPPTVVTLEYFRTLPLPTVRIDNIAAARTAVEHLIGLGHRRIAHITGPMPATLSEDRLQGYRDALAAAGLPQLEPYVVAGDYSLRSGHTAAHRLLGLDRRPTVRRPTAIFAANDEMAFGAINEIRARGLRVPEDVSVVGFDDIVFAGAFHPALTTVRQPRRTIGEQAMAMLAELLAGRPPPVQTLILPTELVVRTSTGPAPS